MKRIIFAVLLFFGTSLVVTFAQAPSRRVDGFSTRIPTSTEGIDSAVVARVGVLRNQLNLNDTQALAIIKILRTSYAEEAHNAKDFKTMTPQDRTSMRQATIKTEKEITDQLTDEQKVKYDKFKQFSRQRRVLPGVGGPGGASRRN